MDSAILTTSESDAVLAFAKVLDLAIEEISSGRLAVPADEIHQEILVPLLPALLADPVIRAHWKSRAGFFPGLRSHLEAAGDRPAWTANDFEIHVAASYSAGPDAKALADTLLSEESMRGLVADLMNRALAESWEVPTITPEVDVKPATPVPVSAWHSVPNPIAGASSSGTIAGSDWQKSNPLARREAGLIRSRGRG